VVKIECNRKCNNATCCKTLEVNLYWQDFINYDYEFTEGEFDRHVARKDNGECIYLENNKCSIYNNRPLDCRNYYCDKGK
jgi:Fe-S-cluster containining protein